MVEKSRRRRARARVLTALTRSAGWMPTQVLESAFAGLARLARWSRFERIALANLEIALGAETSAKERLQIARGVRRHAARQAAEWIRLARGAPRGSANARWIEALVVLDPSIAILEEELARGRGALIVTAHLGNWELCAARLALAGFAGSVVGYERPRDPAHEWFVAMRRGYGVGTIGQHENPRAILRELARGRIVGLLADLEVRRLSGEFVPFFGIPALTMTAPAALARAARAPLVPVRCVAEGARYRLSVEAPIAIERALDLGDRRTDPDETTLGPRPETRVGSRASSDRDRAALGTSAKQLASGEPASDRRRATIDLCARTNLLFERWIRAAPEQWAWHQPRWRTRPGGIDAIPLHGRRRGVFTKH